MPERQNEVINWIYPKGLGHGPHYYRNPYDKRCESRHGVRIDANELTRPHDPGPRAEGLRPGEGYYLDLVDEARGGPADLDGVPVYYERHDEGDSSVRLSYWMLFGMHAPPGRAGASHEGDWERLDVLLNSQGDEYYEPRAVQIGSPSRPDEPVREVPWDELPRTEGDHPVIAAARGSHDMSPANNRESCTDCLRWQTSDALANVRAQLWYGFGGAWGEPGTDDATTGPLGPHGLWPYESQSSD